LTLADRLKPARRIEALATAGSGCAETLLAGVAVLEGMCIDFGLSAVVLGLVVLLLASGTVLVDWLRERDAADASVLDCVEGAGLRSD
jgi:hypothetical protein